MQGVDVLDVMRRLSPAGLAFAAKPHYEVLIPLHLWRSGHTLAGRR